MEESFRTIAVCTSYDSRPSHPPELSAESVVLSIDIYNDRLTGKLERLTNPPRDVQGTVFTVPLEESCNAETKHIERTVRQVPPATSTSSIVPSFVTMPPPWTRDFTTMWVASYSTFMVSRSEPID
jgi:hypothetical protein